MTLLFSDEFIEPEELSEESTELLEELPEEEEYPDYMKLLYKHTVNRDAEQEEIYAAYTEKLESIETQLQEVYSILDWILAMLIFFVVYVLFRSVRRWVNTIGGFKDVY